MKYLKERDGYMSERVRKSTFYVDDVVEYLMDRSVRNFTDMMYGYFEYVFEEMHLGAVEISSNEELLEDFGVDLLRCRDRIRKRKRELGYIEIGRYDLESRGKLIKNAEVGDRFEMVMPGNVFVSGSVEYEVVDVVVDGKYEGRDVIVLDWDDSGLIRKYGGRSVNGRDMSEYVVDLYALEGFKGFVKSVKGVMKRVFGLFRRRVELVVPLMKFVK